MSLSNKALPERPRLLPGCCVFELQGELVVRSISGSFRIDPDHREAIQRVLQRLDGLHDFPRLLAGESVRDAFYTLRLLASFAEGGLLGDGPPQLPKAPLIVPQTILLQGVTLVLLDGGLFSKAVERGFKSLGATVCRGDLALAGRSGAVAIASPDGPDLLSLESTSSTAIATGVMWLPIVPFGDGILAGPLFRSPAPPCWRCLELRWLGLSPRIALEVAYFRFLRGGGHRAQSITTAHEAAECAALVLPGVAARLTNPAEARYVSVTRRESGATERSGLEPSPECKVCSEVCEGSTLQAPSGRDWLDSPLPLMEVGRRLADLVGRPCGLASILSEPDELQPDQAGLFKIAVGRFALPEPETIVGEQDNWCHGAAATRDEARSLATVEALERYSGLSRPSPGVWGDYESVRSEALLPTELPLFSDAQYSQPGFPYRPFDPAEPLYWSRGYDLTQDRTVLVPASAAWYGYHDGLLGESSNGVAAHSSRRHAILAGALELVERDAFMIHWLHRLSPPRLDASDDETALAIVSCIEKAEYQVHLLDITTDLGIPVALALGVHEKRRKPALLLGAGAGLEPRAAARRALNELYSAASRPLRLWRLKPPLDPARVRCLADHSRAYEHPDWLQHASFLWESNRRAAPRAPAGRPIDDLAALRERLEACGHGLIGVDLAPRDVAQHGLYVVRAIVPGLQPLGLAPGGRFGGSRLYEAPVRMGYRDALPLESNLNPIPHCFP